MDPGTNSEVIAHLLKFVEQTSEFVGVSDPWGRILYLNPAAQKRLGVVEIEGLSLADLFPPEAFGYYYDVVRPELLRSGAWSGEVMVNAAGSGAIPMHISTIANLGPGGETNGGVVFAHELARLDPVAIPSGSDVDAVTGLLNRPAFEDHMRHALAAARRDGGSCALVLVEVADSTEVSASLDDAGAPGVMRALGGRMLQLARTIDIVGRVGDRQLGLFLRGVRSQSEALRIAEMANAALADPPVTTAGGTVAIAVSLGVAFSDSNDAPTDLIERASAAMFHEPSARRVVDTDAVESETSLTMNDFRVAMSHGHVVPYAQPVADLRTGLVVGYRGCARWSHHTLGLLGAGSFTEMISESPLANEVDLFVARETAAALLLATRNADPRLYTPVSKRLIGDVRTEQYLAEIADAYFLSLGQIHLQLARPLLDHAAPAFIGALQSLRDAGIAFVLTGVTDPAEIERPADQGFREVHLSRHLVNAAANDGGALDANARHEIAEIIRVAHDRGLIVAATGVNDRRLADALVELGCDLATGDIYGALEPTRAIEGPASAQ
jgi:diguanylate cyclase (GGDEF)-like protein